MDQMTLEKWGESGKTYGEDFRKAQWMIGSWWATGEDLFGEQAAQYINATRVNVHLLQRYAKVARAFNGPYAAILTLSISHHEESLKLKPELRQRWLKDAEHWGWDTREFRRRIKEYLANERSQQGANQ